MGQRIYRLFPALTCAVSKAGCLTGTKYWLALSAFEVFDRYYELKIAIRYLQSTLRITREHSYRILKQYNGLLWDYCPGTVLGKPGHVRIYAPEEVARVFGVSEEPGRWETRPVNELVGRGFKSFLYAHLMDFYHAGIPVTKTFVRAEMGFSERSQRVYNALVPREQVTNLEVDSVYEDMESAMKQFYSGEFKAGRDMLRRLKVDTGAGSVILIGAYKRIGNTYKEHGRIKDTGFRRLIGTCGKAGIWASSSYSAVVSEVSRQLSKAPILQC